ncbi:hypothetical protein DFQ10_101854 [Winogradskyella eximia]|uniref:O-antigen ligase-like membrane protein n=1 Tax=Winogradskyella eximia TaxID=262006 RepID=A0A3D9HC58_9FLAO|nr:hypothetical protein DFQ10_101854 [Winogradskyella eximia]
MIIIPILILFAIILAKLKKGIFAAFLVLVATKSIVDAFWNIRMGPLSFGSIGGLLIPILFYPTLLNRKNFPKSWRLNATFLFLALSLSFILALPVKLSATLELLILNLNIYMGFFLIPSLITNKKRLKQLLLAIIICGLFPIAVSLFQFQTGIIFYARETVGLTRYVGFYHDAFPVRFYGLMTLLAILMYFQFFKPQRFLKYFLYGVTFSALFSVYLVFSKAGVGITGLWIALIMFFSKSKVKQTIAIAVALIVVSVMFGDVIYGNIEQLFSKETGYQAGEIKDARYTLAGRGYVWQEYWDFWTNEQPLFFQIFGDGLTRPTHNEFLRLLLISGVVGVVIFVFFIIRMFNSVFKANREYKLFGLMLLTMFIVDCTGLMPGNYYFYNILVWGLIGLTTLNKSLE